MGFGASLRQHGGDVAQGLLGLDGEVIAFKFLLGIPADLAGHENLAAGGFDAVGVPFGRGPVRGLENLDHGAVILGLEDRD